MKITQKAGFFKTREYSPKNAAVTKTENKSIQTDKLANSLASEVSRNRRSENSEKSNVVNVSAGMLEKIKFVEGVLNELEISNASRKLAQIAKEARRERFTVAVVGEFSRGKSTFINKLLERDILPVDDLPSTAIMTRIRYSRNEVMVYVDDKGNKAKSYPLDNISWDGLTAENFGGTDATGFSVIGVDDEWLEKNGIELIDTPGAGDLEQSRAKVIGTALLGCDAAIITVSATNAMSLSEKLFIEQRLIAKKTPFLMLVLTKLDQIPLSERKRVIEFVKSKLRLWKTDIPIFIPYNVDMPDDEYDEITGLDKIKKCISAWRYDPKRVELTEIWIKQKLREVVEDELVALREQNILMQVSETERETLIEKKKQKLYEAENRWEELKLELISHRRECHNTFMSTIESKQHDVIERLQYEAGHASDPLRWWQEDYPYRLKIELSNMSVNIENVMAKTIGDDIKWLNANLDANFKTHVLCEKETIIDKENMGSGNVVDTGLVDLSKKRTAARVGTTAATIALAALLASSGGFVLLATMGVGTGANIVTEKIFKGKIDKQREVLKGLIAESVPKAIENAIEESSGRIEAVYDEISNAATAKQKEWFDTQEQAIENSLAPVDAEKCEEINNKIQKLTEMSAVL